MAENNSKDSLVIVGGGYAGTTTLLHVLLKALNDPSVTTENPLAVTMIERAPQQLYGGIAYGQTPHHSYNLNLSAKRVTPFDKDEIPAGFPTFEDFVEMFAADNPKAQDQFINTSRQLYGQYLQHVIDVALEQAGDKVIYKKTFGQVTDFTEDKGGVTLQMEDGNALRASQLVLATGFKEAVSPAYAFNVRSHPNYLDYPYAEKGNRFFKRVIDGPQNTPEDSALVIGTGLSAMDSAIRLLDNGYQGKITMMSRRGLMHAIYRQTADDPRERLSGEPRPESELAFTRQTPDFIAALDQHNGFDDMFKSMRKEMFQRLREGYTTEEVLSHWEKYVPQVFAKYPDELAEFLLKYETAINVMRVGTTPGLADKILDAAKRGQLEIISGRIEDMIPEEGNKFSVTYRPNNRHGQRVGPDRTRSYSTIVNGIGNSTKYDLPADEIQDPLWSNLRRKNGYTVHELRDGVKVTENFQLVSGDGTAYDRVTVVGTPVSGHMNVTAYPYPEKDGSGARLGAFTLNIQGILGGVLAMVNRQYDNMRDRQSDKAEALPAPAPAAFVNRPQPA